MAVGTFTLVEDATTDAILEVGETWTYTSTSPFAATQAMIDNGLDIVNTVTIGFDETAATQNASATTTIAQDLKITKVVTNSVTTVRIGDAVP